VPPAPTVSLREVFRGRRGLFLAALLIAEFGGAMQGLAYTTVLPVVAAELDGFGLYGATLSAGSIAAVLMLSVAGTVLGRLRPARTLLLATGGYVAGAAMAVFATQMSWVLTGTAVRGVAGGLLAGFGVGAIGSLFDERERPRVFGVFALVWLLPSLVGPLLNAGITEWVGWRWALAWPAVIVVGARVMMGRYVAVVPWQRSVERAHVGPGLVVAVGLVVGALGSAARGPWGAALLAGGIVLGAVGTGVFLVRATRHRPLARVVFAFTALCASFFGLFQMLSLIMIEGLGRPLVWSSSAVSAGLVAWSLMGLRPRPHARPDVVATGAVAIVLGAAGLLVAVVVPVGTPAAVLVVAAAAVAGVGMGMSYPVLSSEVFDVPGSPPASAVGAAVAFAETAGTAWVVLLAGGIYSAAHSAGIAPRPALVIVLAVLAAVCVASLVLAATRAARPPRGAAARART